MEAQRDLTQIIVHVDMDAFYASVELLDDPELAGKPFAVRTCLQGAFLFRDTQYDCYRLDTVWFRRRHMKPGSSASGQACLVRHTIKQQSSLCSSSAEFIARKLCPELLVKRIHFPRYSEMSHQVMAIFRRYDPTMCAAGCDEAYLKCAPFRVLRVHV